MQRKFKIVNQDGHAFDVGQTVYFIAGNSNELVLEGIGKRWGMEGQKIKQIVLLHQAIELLPGPGINQINLPTKTISDGEIK